MKTYIELVDEEVNESAIPVVETVEKERLEEDENVFEAEDEESEGKYGKELAELMIIWIIQQCLMYAFQCEFAAAPGQETFNIQNDDKVKEKFDRLATILDVVKVDEDATLKPVADGKCDGTAVGNDKIAKALIEACPKEHGDEIREILKELKDYLGNQVAAFKLN